MDLYLEIKGDVNDADYIYRKTKVTQQQLDEVIPILKKLKGHRYNWEDYEDYISEEEYYEIEDYIPCMDNEAVHTITQAQVLQIEVKETII